MLDQDTARALLTIADETHARIAFVGDRHQLPAVGRGGVLDHAARWARPEACLALETVHRFTDPEYAELSLLMRTGERSGEVFDALQARGLIQIHPTEVERLAALTDVRRNWSSPTPASRSPHSTPRSATSASPPARPRAAGAVTTAAGERLGVGDQIATRRNDRDLGVANRDCWTVTGIDADGGLVVRGRGGARTLPADVRPPARRARLRHHRPRRPRRDRRPGTPADRRGTGAAAAYVGMTRGRNRNTAHLVADVPRRSTRPVDRRVQP